MDDWRAALFVDVATPLTSDKWLTLLSVSTVTLEVKKFWDDMLDIHFYRVVLKGGGIV